jgi:hypothetical protein
MVSTDGILAEIKGVQSNGKNLLSGVMTGNGWKAGTYEDGIFEYDDDADFDSNGEWISPAEGDTLIVSPEIVITKRHIYTVSAYIEGTQTIRVAIILLGQTPELRNITGTGRVYVTTELTAGTYRIVIEASKIRHAQVELADGWDFAPTAFETSSTEVSSRIKQTADGITSTVQRDYATKSQLQQTASSINANITNLDNQTQAALNLKADSADLTMMRNGLETAGVHLDGNNSKIKAVANHFEIQNKDGTKTFSVDDDGNLQGSGDAAFKGAIKNGPYKESGQTKFVNEINPDGSGQLAKEGIKWDEEGVKFNGKIIKPFHEPNSVWDNLGNGSIKIVKEQQARDGISLPVYDYLDGMEVDIINISGYDTSVVAAGGTGTIVHCGNAVSSIKFGRQGVVCRLKAVLEDEYVAWMIVNSSDFYEETIGGYRVAVSTSFMEYGGKVSGMVQFNSGVSFPGIILVGDVTVGNSSHGRTIFWRGPGTLMDSYNFFYLDSIRQYTDRISDSSYQVHMFIFDGTLSLGGRQGAWLEIGKNT